MLATFESLILIRGKKGHLVQGIKGNRIPPHAIAGGNGSYIVGGTPTQVILTVRLENGERHSSDVYRKILEKYRKVRLMDSFFEKVKEELSEKTFDYNPETGDITWD